MQWLYLNGDIVAASGASVSALDPAVFHGRALIETFAARVKRFFRLPQHYARLCEGARVLGVDLNFELLSLERAVEGVLDRNQVTDARLRLMVTPGSDGAPPSVILTASPLTDYPPDLYDRGMHVTIAKVRRNETSALSRIKCAAGLLDGLLAREAARDAGFDDAIMLNTRGQVAEATVANVFLVRDGRLVTPPVEDGALPGVTRAAILDLAREAGFEVAEEGVTTEELRAADEAFLTNSVMGVMPISRLKELPIPRGPATLLLRDALCRAASGE